MDISIVPLWIKGEGERFKNQTYSNTLGQEALVCLELEGKGEKELFELETLMIGHH